MPHTLGYHLVKSGYGLWLPGDVRGHWSSAWDDKIGYIEPHTLHAGDPVRRRMAAERMRHAPVRWSAQMVDALAHAIGRCCRDSPWRVAACCIEPTHLHLLVTYSKLDIERTAKWLAQQMTRAVHERTTHTGPVFCAGKWCMFIFDTDHWGRTRAYIERHNTRRNLPAQPWPFVAPIDR